MMWCRRINCPILVCVFWALTSAAAAAAQSVAGIEIDHALPLQRQPNLEKRMLERKDSLVRTVEVYSAPLARDIGDGKGHVQIARMEFAGARKIDDVLREMSSNITSSGQVLAHSETRLSVSTRDARQMAIEMDLSGWRFGGEFLLVSDARGHTIWLVQVVFVPRSESMSLDQDRQLARKLLASVRVVETPRVKDHGADLAAKPPDRPSAGCTLWESEEKIWQVANRIGETKARDADKADRIESRFMEAVNRYMEPSSSPAQAELMRHAFCSTLDELLLDLNR